MDLIFELKDNAFDAKNIEELHKKVLKHFTKDGYSADVKIDGDAVLVHFSEEDLVKDQKDIQKVRELCEKHNFSKAKEILDIFLKKHPFHSEAYRILAQITREEGDIDKAIDICLESLKCDPKNIWGLMLMGNIFCRDKDNFEAALKYYNSILEYFPDNAIAINNIASVYAEQNKKDEAAELFKRVIELDKTYENAYYGLAQLYYNDNKFEKAFEISRQGCVNGIRRPENPKVSEMIRKLMVASAHAICEGYNYKNVFLGIKDIIESLDHNEIREVADPSLKEFAKLEYGPIHGKNYHTIKYNPDRPFVYHLMVHELMHLDMILSAQRNGACGKFVVLTSDNEAKFRARYSTWQKNLINKIGYTKANEIFGHILYALNLQVMNCPLDLFVEKRIFDKYKIMRPMQLLSLIAQEEVNIQGVVGSAKSNFLPQSILKANKIMNIVTSINLEVLYGIKLYDYYKPTKEELDTAKDLYDEYLAYSDYKPGEEYELIEYFAESLGLKDYFSLIPEFKLYKTNAKSDENQELLNEVSNNSQNNGGNSIVGLTEEQKESQDNFYKQNKDGEDETKTMMMSMYMLDALQKFDGKPMTFIKDVAFDIATIGINGIDPANKYVVKSLDDKEMSGYETLAYYYVSWKLFNPELHKTLQLPFDTAWDNAISLFNKMKN